MAWRTVLLQNQTRLSLDHGQLKCDRKDGAVTLPIEDITVLVLDSPKITLSTALMGALQNNGVAVVVCDEKHHPGGLFLPYHQHTRISSIAPLQAGWSLPLRKRCWQRIVKAKIINQGRCLEMLTGQGQDKLTLMAKGVDSGDSQNLEAAAARYYWDKLLGCAFKRKTHRDKAPGFINSALNYGYAIIRAAVARSITAHGLLACFGLHHHSALNQFNLADDLVEPLRPIVDHKVYEMAEAKGMDLTSKLDKEHRQELTGLATAQVCIADENHSLTNATDIMAMSLVRVLKAKDARKLVLPTFVKGEQDEHAGG